MSFHVIVDDCCDAWIMNGYVKHEFWAGEEPAEHDAAMFFIESDVTLQPVEIALRVG